VTTGDPFDARITESFLNLIENATSAEALQAQNIILQRIALQGDVVPSRVQPPANITEIGGYLNLLGTLKQTEMQTEVLAGILGVAGPTPQLAWTGAVTPLSFVWLANDRPQGAAQPTIPVSIQVRSDFMNPLQQALSSLHQQGCLLPFLSSPATLPLTQLTAPSAQPDPLLYIGRVLLLAGATALVNPASDALALIRSGTSGPFQIAANALGTGASAVAAANYQALSCSASACTVVALTGARMVPLGPVLANAGFYSPDPLPQPTSSGDSAWSRLTNITGLVAGQTKLGDELSLLYPWSMIASSVFASAVNWIWNGSVFAAPA
jgi:hypothetical protein